MKRIISILTAISIIVLYFSPTTMKAQESQTSGTISGYNEDYFENEEQYEQYLETETNFDNQADDSFSMEAKPINSAIFISTDEAGAYLRGQYKDRNKEITFAISEYNLPISYTTAQMKAAVERTVAETIDKAFAETGNFDEGDYLRWNVLGYDGSFNKSGNVLTIRLNPRYLTTLTEEREVTAEIDRLINTKFSGYASKTSYENVKNVYEYITSNVTYNYRAGTNGYYYSTHSALISKYTVCQGICTAIYRILNQMGIDTRLVSNDDHGWLITQIGDRYYNMDPTWDLGKKKNEWGYFLLGSSEFDGAHPRGMEYNTASFVTRYPTAKTKYVAGESDISILYRTHVQDYGWQNFVSNGDSSGTSGQSKRLEAIEIKLAGNKNIGIKYKTHVQDYGWQEWKSNGALSGTSGQSKRLEAICIELTGKDADLYDVFYKVHAEDYGWLGWAQNGEAAGTSGQGKRLEAIQIVVLRKGNKPAGMNTYSYVEIGKNANNPMTKGLVNYNTHVETYGDQSFVNNGSISGTSGESKRLEGVRVILGGMAAGGDILYRTHVQDYGWLNWSKNGEFNGTRGESKRLEAIEIKLSGAVSARYDVYYRVHVQDYGWLGWAKNGAPSGTAGLSKRLEGIQIIVVPKNSSVPINLSRSFISF